MFALAIIEGHASDQETIMVRVLPESEKRGSYFFICSRQKWHFFLAAASHFFIHFEKYYLEKKIQFFELTYLPKKNSFSSNYFKALSIEMDLAVDLYCI